MRTVNANLNTYHGSKRTLIQSIRSRRTRQVPLNLAPVAGSTSKYKVYAGSQLVGETTIRSANARQALNNTPKGFGTIGWDQNRNETLVVNIAL